MMMQALLGVFVCLGVRVCGGDTVASIVYKYCIHGGCASGLSFQAGCDLAWTYQHPLAPCCAMLCQAVHASICHEAPGASVALHVAHTAVLCALYGAVVCASDCAGGPALHVTNTPSCTIGTHKPCCTLPIHWQPGGRTHWVVAWSMQSSCCSR
jgi:hypothetical protein